MFRYQKPNQKNPSTCNEDVFCYSRVHSIYEILFHFKERTHEIQNTAFLKHTYGVLIGMFLYLNVEVMSTYTISKLCQHYYHVQSFRMLHTNTMFNDDLLLISFSKDMQNYVDVSIRFGRKIQHFHP